jgi:hypothetical protein
VYTYHLIEEGVLGELDDKPPELPNAVKTEKSMGDITVINPLQSAPGTKGKSGTKKFKNSLIHSAIVTSKRMLGV